MSHWEDDCRTYRGEILAGRYAHWCCEWDDLPIDETCLEWPCCPFEPENITEAERVEARAINDEVRLKFDADEEMPRTEGHDD